MQVIVVLLIASVVVAAGFLVAFLWTARRGQYDDLDTPPVRMLYDDIRAKDESVDVGSMGANRDRRVQGARTKTPHPLLRPPASESTSPEGRGEI